MHTLRTSDLIIRIPNTIRLTILIDFITLKTYVIELSLIFNNDKDN